MVKRAIVNGIEMDYAEFGDGSGTLVVLPGISFRKVTNSVGFLKNTFKMFMQDYKIYVFDRRNNIGEHYSVYDMAEDTFCVMKHLGINKADIYGASQGGMMAMCIAAEHPETVERMVLGSTAPCANEDIITLCDSWIKAAGERHRADLADLFVKAVYSEKTANAMKRGFLLFAETFTDEELDRFSVLADAIRSFSVVDKLGQIKASTLVIGCYGDKVVGAQASLDIAEKLNCEIYMYDDSYGHSVYDEAPDFYKRVFDFLNPDQQR
ncbi:MAG: alpha/beta hydrolase [Clostridiales bacterium]|nr:alpha/beta hydrolase [Clostridiales bacterium]